MTTTDSLPMGDAVNWAWRTFQENVAFILVVSATVILVPAFIEGLQEMAADESSSLDWILDLVHFFVTSVLAIGVIKVSLKYCDQVKPEFANVFDSIDRVFYYMISVIITVVATFMGLLLLVVPGIIIAIRVQFIGYFIYEEDMGPIAAIQASWEMTSGFTLDLFLFDLLLLAINMLGLLCLGVGLFVSLPVSWLAHAYVYRTLRARPQTVSAPAPLQPPSSSSG